MIATVPNIQNPVVSENDFRSFSRKRCRNAFKNLTTNHTNLHKFKISEDSCNLWLKNGLSKTF
ncbi:hypothetical protein FNO01nite_32300 [Flavobacterium noncentrifugens]|nr:hypothetical protein FNO01nite_32300 [Flavobacterium noncentrifugens]